MPTLNQYNDERGYYIRAGVNNAVITYQTTPQARQLFEELGYSHGSTIPWEMIQDLQSRGDVYTGGSGVDIDEQSHSDLSLSPQQQAVYETYLDGDSKLDLLKEINAVVDEFYEFSFSVSSSKLKDELAAVGNEELVGLLGDFTELPFPVEAVSIEADCISYEFVVDDDVTLVCRDHRLADEPYDFRGVVAYEGDCGETATYSVRDGYFTEWSLETGEESTADSIEERHAAAFTADFGRKSGLGFQVNNWTEVVRKLFLFVRNYDIRPHRNHKGLCTLQELEGKHIWVDAHTTNKSSRKGGLGMFVITTRWCGSGSQASLAPARYSWKLAKSRMATQPPTPSRTRNTDIQSSDPFSNNGPRFQFF